MLFYITNLLTLVVYGAICSAKKKENLFTIVATIHFALLIGLRSVHTGTDTLGYWKSYRLLLNSHASFGEVIRQWNKFPGWAAFFYALTKVLPKNPDLYMLISGVFISVVFTAAVRKIDYCKILPYIIFFLICLTQSMNTTRQHMAMVLIMLAYAFSLKKQYIGAALIASGAVLIHSSAVVAVPIVMAPIFQWNRRRFMMVILGVCVVGVAADFLTTYFTRTFVGYNAAIYTLDGSSTSIGRHAVLYIINILTIIYAYWIIKHGRPTDETEQYLWQMIIVSGVAAIIGVVFARVTIINRCVEFYQLFETIFIPFVLRYRNRYRQIYIACVMGICVLYFLFWVAGNYGDIRPYRTFI